LNELSEVETNFKSWLINNMQAFWQQENQS